MASDLEQQSQFMAVESQREKSPPLPCPCPIAFLGLAYFSTKYQESKNVENFHINDLKTKPKALILKAVFPL